MAGRIPNCGARLLRVLGVLTVVAGVFAMHGLTSHHDAAMAMPGTSMVVMEHPAGVHVMPADEMQDMGGACMAVLTGLVLLLSLLLGLRSLLVWRAVGVPVYRLTRVLGERSPPRVVLSSLGVLRI
ncbi:DUF6153 family protein [Kribbella sp. NPDC004536]|uniref:DUF6153 family protein n=1 Tax=Kribbella sp. NPDC004536 TaxID=3364106 RepID=UPI0036930482